MFMFMMCFQCVDGFILFYTVHTCNNVSCAPTQPRADSELPARSHLWNAGLSSWCCPWCSTLMVSLRMLWLWAEAVCFFPFIAALALRKRGGFGAAWHRCFSLFKVEQENFCTTSTERNSVASEILRDFNVTSATSTVILLFMCPPRIYLLTPSLRPHGLSAGSREGATHHPSFYKTNRVPLTLQSWSESYAFLIVQYV